MRMQVSKVYRVSLDGSSSDSSVFELSGNLSEWLFSVGFWRSFNLRHGTMFDQFEEDEADTKTVSAVATAFANLIRSIEAKQPETIQFVYRHLSDGTTISATVEKAELLTEIRSMHDFLVHAVEMKSTLTFAL
ncbi:hypothetical protein [Caballeronia ptereochthonis]|uniref:hypothetical protein n=1 Tax=Caballeronia ptereochthonis TaxID=1777144 RepID=UPI001358A87D|nr:hypothetical protein [Caballeronia ptereochthonis]